MQFQSPPTSKATLEEGNAFTPRFDAAGLITAVVSDASDGTLLMVAHMNAETLALSLETGIAHYWSRSRNELWKKGETSGNLQTIVELRTDCDQDAIWLRVEVAGHGATCHTGRRSCFYRKAEMADGRARLVVDSEPRFDPEDIYTK